MSAKPKTDDLQTIDPTQLHTVSGGASRASGSESDPAIAAALTGILDSIKSLSSSNQSSGFGMPEMMMFMMMMQQRPQTVAAQPQQPANWTWDANGGYWIVK